MMIPCQRLIFLRNIELRGCSLGQEGAGQARLRSRSGHRTYDPIVVSCYSLHDMIRSMVTTLYEMPRVATNRTLMGPAPRLGN